MDSFARYAFGVSQKMLNQIDLKVDRNYEAISSGFSRMDSYHEVVAGLINQTRIENARQFLTILATLNQTTLEMRIGFDSVLSSIKKSRIEPIASHLKTFIEYFENERSSLAELPPERRVPKLEDPDGFLKHMKIARTPWQSNSLHSLLSDIINQGWAIPTKFDDETAFVVLDLLCHGTHIYNAVMAFVHEQLLYLTNQHLLEAQMDEYNQRYREMLNSFDDFKSSLHSSDAKHEQGLIDKVLRLLREVSNLDFIGAKRSYIGELCAKKIVEFTEMKKTLNEMTAMLHTEFFQHRPEQLKGRWDFSTGGEIRTPIQPWEDKKRVSYALLLFNAQTGFSTQLSKWSTPYTVFGKAFPTIGLPTHQRSDSKNLVHIIYRRFNGEKAEVVGIFRDPNMRTFATSTRICTTRLE